MDCSYGAIWRYVDEIILRSGRHKNWYIFRPELWLLWCLPLYVSAHPQIDSLKSALQHTNGRERAELLLDLSRLTRQKNLDSALIQAQEALTISRQIRDVNLQSRSLQRIGFYYIAADQDTMALEYLLSALHLDRQRGARSSEADVLHLLGRFYMGQDNDVKALDYFFKALKIQEEEKMKVEEGTTLSYIGDVYLFRQETEKAVYFYRQAIERALSTDNLRLITIAGAKAGNNLFRLGRQAEADHYFDMALQAARDIPSVHAEAGIVSVISTAYQDSMLYDKALKLNLDFLKTAIAHESKILEARSYENLAGIYAVQGNLDLSAQHLWQAYQIFQSMHFPVAQVGHRLMEVYLEQGLPDSAIDLGNKILLLAGKSNDLKGQQSVLEELIEAYRTKGDMSEITRSQDELLALNKILYDEEMAEQIAEMEVRYRTGQKEQAIALLEDRQARARLLRNALLIGLCLLVVIGVLIFNRQRLKIDKNRTDLENVRLKQHQLRKDLEFKNRQLTTHSLHLLQKNRIMRDLKEGISDYQKSQNGKPTRQLQKLQHLIDHSFNLDRDWEEFRLHFESVHKGFFQALKKHSPQLTTNELRLSALVKLNLNIKETATILNISPDSVKTARYRLRKKLQLSSDQDLSEFLLEVEQQVTG